jgi:hypothetical protein
MKELWCSFFRRQPLEMCPIKSPLLRALWWVRGSHQSSPKIGVDSQMLSIWSSRKQKNENEKGLKWNLMHKFCAVLYFQRQSLEMCPKRALCWRALWWLCGSHQCSQKLGWRGFLGGLRYLRTQLRRAFITKILFKNWPKGDNAGSGVNRASWKRRFSKGVHNAGSGREPVLWTPSL